MSLLVNTLLSEHRRICGDTGANWRRHNVFAQARTGQRIRFAPWELVEVSTLSLLSQVEDLWRSAQGHEARAQALAVLWLGLIGIHPFPDANGRSTKALIRRMLSAQGLRDEGLDGLDTILLTQDTQKNMQELYRFFYHHLSRRFL